jgi:hypothetical protein
MRVHATTDSELAQKHCVPCEEAPGVMEYTGTLLQAGWHRRCHCCPGRSKHTPQGAPPSGMAQGAGRVSSPLLPPPSPPPQA